MFGNLRTDGLTGALKRPADSRGALQAAWLAMRLTGTVSSRIGGRFAAKLWFTPWRADLGPAAIQSEQHWLSQTTPFTLDVGDCVLSGWHAGRGPTVLFVHGWGERAARLGAFIEPMTSRGMRVVGIDLPAHGDSQEGETDLYSLAGTVASVAAAVEARGVLAHSIGALVTLMAFQEGLHARTAAFVAPAVRLEHGLEKFATMFKVPSPALRGLRYRIERRFGPEVWDHAEGDRVARNLNIPGLIVHDRRDPQVDFADAELLAQAWPLATLQETEGLGHRRILHDDRVVQTVAEFTARTIQGAVDAAGAAPGTPEP